MEKLFVRNLIRIMYDAPLGILLTGFARDYVYEKLQKSNRRITLMDESKANIAVLHRVVNNTIG